MCIYELGTHAAAVALVFSSGVFSFPLGSTFSFWSSKGAVAEGAAAGVEAVGVLEAAPAGFSRLKTLLILLTYLPKLLRLSTFSLASEGPGADMLAASVVSWMGWNQSRAPECGERETKTENGVCRKLKAWELGRSRSGVRSQRRGQIADGGLSVRHAGGQIGAGEWVALRSGGENGTG